jgi:cytidylate kinase
LRAFVVAIDGPAGAGKSATARGIARRLGLVHVDSGAMYRAAAWLASRRGASLEDERAILAVLEKTRLTAGPDGLRVDGECVEEHIRSAEAGEAASRVAVHPRLRERLVRIQRSLAVPPGLVMEGRDIGTVVFPRADLKIFLTASVEARARRRLADLAARGEAAEPAEIEAAIRERDRRDSERATSPLTAAPDALPLDTTDLSLEEQVDLACHWASLARTGPGRMTPFYRFGHDFVAHFAKVFLKFKIEGLERIPAKGPLIAACNHISFWDPPLVGANFPRVLHFVAKRELFENRLFGAMLRGYNSIPIHRGPQGRAGLRGAVDVLGQGGAVLIFPEGTRNKSGTTLAPRSGIAHLAATARAPVLPIRITGSNQIRRSMLRQVQVRITFGSPMMPPVGTGRRREDPRAFARRVMDAIESLQGSGR